MSSASIDDWDEGFLVDAIKWAEEAEASRNPVAFTQAQNPNPNSSFQDNLWTPIPNIGDNPNPNPNPNPNLTCLFQDHLWPPIPNRGDEVGKIISDACFSPPPELSQRVSERIESSSIPFVENGRFGGRCGGKSGSRRDKEIEWLKEELGRISKKLSNKERECVELHKDREKKDEQLKDAFWQIGRKDAEICRMKCTDLSCHPKANDVLIDGESVITGLKNQIMIDNGLAISSRSDVQSKRTKAMGVQTDSVQDGDLSNAKDKQPAKCNFSSKLYAIWGSPVDKMLGKNLVAELFVTCSADFCTLFKSMDNPSNSDLDCWPNRSISDMALHQDSQSQFIDAAKVSRLYEILIKMHHEVVPLESLLEALLDLCTLENVVATHKSLRVLHAIVQYLSCSTRFDRRNSVLVDQSQNKDFHEGKSIGLEKRYKSETSTMSFFDLENLSKNADSISRTSLSLSFETFVILFEKMQQIALNITEEYVQAEALSIMNLMLMASKPSESEKFGLVRLLEGLPQLFRKEAGLCVRKQSVRLLFLLLNCPQMLSMFCDCHRHHTEHGKVVDGLIATPKLQGGIKHILEGLAEYLASVGTNTEEHKLQRNIIIMLAFIASSGISGFNVLLYSATPQRINFLELIIRVLASVMDAVIDAKLQTFCKERTSLVREALILLNRLVSNPTYSKVTLGVLTSSATASLTIDVVNRTTRRSRRHWKHDSGRKMQAEDEILDLAKLLKARVFTFLDASNPLR